MRKIFLFLLMSIFAYNTQAQTLQTQLAGKINIVVAKDGSGNFLKIQDAINSISDTNTVRKVIFIKKGIYYEKVVVPLKKNNITIIGEDADSTILTNNDYYGKVKGMHTFNCYTLRVDADDFFMFNMTIENSANGIERNVALHTNGDRQTFIHCRITGFQDTYFHNLRTRNYMKDCFIEGSVDYIFGFGIVVFDSCQIHNLPSSGYMTASGTPINTKMGEVFRYCKISNTPGITFYLGRPWWANCRTVLYKCWESAAVMASGWQTWNGNKNTVYYREYQCTGPGYKPASRTDLGSQAMSDAEANKYQYLDSIFSHLNFPQTKELDTAEIMPMYRRFRSNTENTPELVHTVMSAARDTFPACPSTPWKFDLDKNDIYNIVKKTYKTMMDSSNSKFSIQKILYNNIEIPNFNLNTKEYVLNLPTGTTSPPKISILLQNANFSVVHPKSSLTRKDTVPGFSKVTIFSKDKIFEDVYQLFNNVDSAYTNADLSIVIYNYTDTIKIKKGVYNYNIALTKDTTVKAIIPYTKINGVNYKITNPSKMLPGTATIVTTANDKKTSKTYTFNFTVFTNIGNSSVYQLKILDNPVGDNLEFNIADSYANLKNIEIYELSGKLVLKKALFITPSGKIKLNVSAIKPGLYIFKLGSNTGKFIKK